MSAFPILVYGATGYTGRLVCDALRRAGSSFAIAGRCGPRLAAIQRELDLPGAAVHCAALDDRRSLLSLLSQTRVILSCVGAYQQIGHLLQDAALAARCHYLDLTGEYAFIAATQRRDDEARARGVALVNAVGFDVVPTDAAAVLACRALPGAAHLRIAFAKSGGASRGTLRSMLSFAHPGMAYQDGRLSPEPLGLHVWSPPFAPPFDGWGCLSVPWGDLASAPRSTGVRNVRTYAALPRAVLGPLRLLLPAVRLCARGIAGPAGRLFDRALSLIPEGPSEQARLGAHVAVLAEAQDEAGARRCAWVRAGDGYLFTAAAAALCARLAAAPAFPLCGALTPTQAFGAQALLDGLRDHGVTWGIA